MTFLFTDIEGSTERWASDEAAMAAALAAHDEALREAVESRGGAVFKHTGDGVCAVFPGTSSAVEAALDAQRRLELPVRMGLHTGEAELRDGDYFGPTLNRVARIMDAGHGGQILLSAATSALAPDVVVTDLGRHRLKGLAAAEQIAQVGDAEFPPLRVAAERRGNLPRELNAFVGRQNELDAVTDAVLAHRLVTLLGVGGTGKTRLSIEAAHHLSPTFPDGCWLVELARVTVPEAVPVAIAVGLGITVPESGNVLDVVARRLRHDRRLVIVDNCEHVLDAVADAIERILAESDTVSILATSREPLMVAGEHLAPTPSLGHDDAVTLFLERAGSEAGGVQFDERQLAAVGQLCDRLDRLPLAIELAASRMRTMSPVEAVERLDQRFRLLVGGRRSRMERHQTMRSTVEWSYELCDEVEQQVFDRLSVFATEFGLDAAVSVAALDDLDHLDVEDALGRLVDRSLVQRQLADDGTTRFRLLETMRAYGHERLAECGSADAVREAHAVYIDEVVCALGLRSLGPDERDVYLELRSLAPEALLALDWSIDGGDLERAYRIGSSCYYASAGTALAMLGRVRAALDDPDIDSTIGPIQEVVLDALTSSGWSSLTAEERSGERAREVIRSQPSMPAGCWSFGPTVGISSVAGAASIADDADLIDAWLDTLIDAPPSVRFQEFVFAADSLGFDESPRREHYLGEARSLAERMGSTTALRRCMAVEALVEDRREVVSPEFVGRARSLIDAIDEPTGGDIVLAARFLRLVARQGAAEMRGIDLRRPLQWVETMSFDLGLVNALMSTAVALVELDQGCLAGRAVAALGPDHVRRSCVDIYRDRLPDDLIDALRNESQTEPSIEPIRRAVSEVADEIDRHRLEEGAG